MLIPRHWSRATGTADDPEGKRFLLKIWGWSANVGSPGTELEFAL